MGAAGNQEKIWMKVAGNKCNAFLLSHKARQSIWVTYEKDLGVTIDLIYERVDKENKYILFICNIYIAAYLMPSSGGLPTFRPHQ